MLSLLLLLTGLSLGVSASILARAVWYGRQSVRDKKSTSYHKTWIDRFIVSLLLPVGLIEFIVRAQGGRWEAGSLFWIHMGLVLLFLLMLGSMRLVWHGTRAPTVHRWLSRAVLFLFGFVMLTGFWLVAYITS